MKVCSCCSQSKAKGEFYIHPRSKDGLTSQCKDCIRAASRRNHEQNRDVQNARLRSYYANNREQELTRKAEYYVAKREEILVAHSEWHEKNAKSVSVRAKKWKAANQDKVKAASVARYAKDKASFIERNSRRRATVKQATPVWSNAEVVNSFYRAVAILNAHDGPAKFSVDHIVPLRSKLVSGLHAHTNLTIVPLPENMAKNNRHWPDMP